MLYKHTGDPVYMRTFTSVYYGRKDYDLARKTVVRCYGHYKINKGYGPNNIINGTWYSEEGKKRIRMA